MSLTVSRLMELPSLRRAKVLGGRGGLDRIVSSISVLEYSSTTDTQKKLFESKKSVNRSCFFLEISVK